MKTDFEKSIDFILEIDGLKNIFRRTKIATGDRYENDAEHSWHICVMAHVLRRFFEEDENFGPINVDRAVKMLLIHDVVELYAGDTYCYDTEGQKDKFEREIASAEKIFGMLPEKEASDYISLWLEFDKEESNDAVFAAIMDKLEPVILNYKTNGICWTVNNISKSQVRKRMDIVYRKAPETLKNFVDEIIEKSVEKGFLVNE